MRFAKLNKPPPLSFTPPPLKSAWKISPPGGLIEDLRYSRSPRKLFALEGLYQLKNSGTSKLSRFPYLKKYAKDFLFCPSNYLFLCLVFLSSKYRSFSPTKSTKWFSLPFIIICESIFQCDAKKIPSFCSLQQNVWNKLNLLIPNLKWKVKRTGIPD